MIGNGPHMGEEGIERIEAIQKRARHMIDRVKQAGVGFDEPTANYFDGAGDADS